MRRGALLEYIARNLKGKRLVSSIEVTREGSEGIDVGQRNVPSRNSMRSPNAGTLHTIGVWGIYGRVRVNMSWRRKSGRGYRQLRRHRRVALYVFRYRLSLGRRGKGWVGGSIEGGGHIGGDVRGDLRHPMSL